MKNQPFFYVYAHYTIDSGELFYIGKGKNGRHRHSSGRNQYWKHIVQAHGFRSEILSKHELESEAFHAEIEAINLHKPRANFTKGGSGGFTGYNSGNFSKGVKPWNTGKICPDISERQRGTNNPQYGKPSKLRRKIICIDDQRIFDSVSEAIKTLKISKSSLYNSINLGHLAKGLRLAYV